MFQAPAPAPAPWYLAPADYFYKIVLRRFRILALTVNDYEMKRGIRRIQFFLTESDPDPEKIASPDPDQENCNRRIRVLNNRSDWIQIIFGRKTIVLNK
uniref:Uncharacterized protein n=1 Tax=Romanomermis culicivorax TaxID=13658 RepID=A0A915J5W5_ROMCU